MEAGVEKVDKRGDMMKGKYRNQSFIIILILFIMILLLVVFGKSFGVLFIIANLIAVMFIKYINQQYQKKGNDELKIAGRMSMIVYSLFLLTFIVIEGFIILEMDGNEAVEPGTVDYVIILGAGLKGDKPSKSLKTRLNAGTDFLKNNKEIPVIVSGGQGPGETITEAEAMARYLKKHGISENRIYKEDRSTSTYENLQYSKQLMGKFGVTDPTVLIVTNDFHIARTKIIAKELELTGYYLSAESPGFVKINYLIREYFAFVKTWVVQII